MACVAPGETVVPGQLLHTASAGAAAPAAGEGAYLLHGSIRAAILGRCTLRTLQSAADAPQQTVVAVERPGQQQVSLAPQIGNVVTCRV